MSGVSWKTIAADLQRRIVEGDLKPGERIPTGDQVAAQWGVHRNTGHRAIEELQRQGIVVRRRGRGTTVAEPTVPGTRRVALLVDGYSPVHNFPSGNLLRGIQEVLGEDTHLIVADSRHDPEAEIRQLRKLAHEVDGVILYSTGHKRAAVALRGLVEERFPLVLLDRVPEGVAADAVVTENRGATFQAVRVLMERGHRRIGFLSFDKPDFSSVLERFEGYREAMADLGPAEIDDLVRWLPRDSDRSMPVFLQTVRDTLFALLRQEEPITALFCVEDQVGIAAVRACARLGVAVPEGLEIATFSDWSPMALGSPWNVHRLVQRNFEIGRAAANLLLDRIALPSREPRTVRVDADFFLAGVDLVESAALVLASSFEPGGSLPAQIP